MTAPNLISPTTINGKTTYLAATTTESDLLTNSSSSGKAIKIISLYVANIDGSSAADITVKIYSAASGGTGYEIASTVSVPADASIVIIGRDAPIWLEEDRRIAVVAGTASDLIVVCSYEEVS